MQNKSSLFPLSAQSDARGHLRLAPPLPTTRQTHQHNFETNLPNHQKNEISTFSLSISFIQAQLCAYSIKTKYCEVDNVMKTNLSPVERKCQNVGRFTK